MAAAGFVDNGDLLYNAKNGEIKGRKPGAHMWQSDLFKSNIADWAWGFHDTYMKREGASESGFDDLIARMPRNMGALVSFLVHNEDRIKRDAATRENAVGDKAAGNSFLAQNPVAGLDSVKTSLEALLSVAAQPAMKTLGESLEATASGLQKLASVYGQFAHDHPDAAEKIGIGSAAGLGAAGGWLSWKLLTGFGRFFGFGGGAEASASGIGAILPGTGLMLPLAAGAAAAGPLVGIPYWLSGYHDPGVSDAELERSRRSRMVYHPGGWVDDPEAARARALSGLNDGAHTVQVETNVHGEATINATIRVEAGSELLNIVNQALDIRRTVALNPVAGGHTGRMDSDAAPIARGMPGRL
jgi:hypothetical protein